MWRWYGTFACHATSKHQHWERLSTTGKTHIGAKIDMAHMGANDSLGGWEFLATSLNMVVVDLLGVTYINMDGCQPGRDISHLKLLGRQWRGSHSGISPLCSWAVRSETVTDGGTLHLLEEGGPLDVKGSGVLAAFKFSKTPQPRTPSPLILSSWAFWPQSNWPPTAGDSPHTAYAVFMIYQVTSVEIISHKQWSMENGHHKLSRKTRNSMVIPGSEGFYNHSPPVWVTHSSIHTFSQSNMVSSWVCGLWLLSLIVPLFNSFTC